LVDFALALLTAQKMKNCHKLNSALTKEEASESKESGGASIFSLLV